MAKWIDVETTIRVYLPEGYTEPGAFYEDDGDYAAAAIAEVADQKMSSNGAIISIQGYDPGEVRSDS